MASTFTVTPNAYMPLGEFVLTTLRTAILTGEIQPGERLMEIQISEQMGVSRTPVREAIKKLADEGLVKITPHRGASVAGISAKNLIDVLEVRTVLEKMAFRLAFDHITPDEIDRLSDVVDLMHEAANREDTITMVEYDEDFHNIIYKAAGNDKLREILYNLSANMYRYRREYGLEPSSRERAYNEHMAIIRSFIDHDFDNGMDIVEVHIENQKAFLLAKIREDAGGSRILPD